MRPKPDTLRELQRNRAKTPGSWSSKCKELTRNKFIPIGSMMQYSAMLSESFWDKTHFKLKERDQAMTGHSRPRLHGRRPLSSKGCKADSRAWNNGRSRPCNARVMRIEVACTNMLGSLTCARHSVTFRDKSLTVMYSN